MVEKPIQSSVSREADKKENRRYARRRTSDYLLATDLDTGRTLGRAANVSPRGVMVMTADTIPVGKCYHLDIALPVPVLNKQHLELIVECRWSTYRKAADLWENGLEINEISHDDRHVLQQLVIQLMTNNGECRTTASDHWGRGHEKIEYVRLRRYRRDTSGQ